MKPKTLTLISLALSFSLAILQAAQGYQCGWQAGGGLCPNNLCCSKWGWCGTTDAFCGDGCQSNCPQSPPPAPPSPPPAPPSPPTPTPSSPISDIFPEDVFENFLMHRNAAACPARGFYSYSAFITAANRFPEFGNTGDLETRKREIAAFFGQTSHETTGGWSSAPDGPFAWGYCFKEEVGGGPGTPYCEPSARWPCVPGQYYFGRGPIQLSWNYNYGQAGEALELELLSNPGLVAADPVVSFETAIWFWMTPQAPKPSCHDVIVGKWTPTPSDIAANRLPGFGLTTNIINGGLECGFPGPDKRVESRIGFYKRYCDIFGVSYGHNLDCYNQRPFNWNLMLKSATVSS